jgi:NADPH2 dehydrogenase
MTPANQPALAALHDELIAAHRGRFGPDADADLFVGLQLTHSGRYARPDVYDRPAPLAAWRHPVLDRRFPEGVPVVKDGELEQLEEDFATAARLARDAGFRFVDIKACHGYLGHELLGARGRSGPYGGSLENRTRFMRQVIERIRAEVAGLQVVVRLSAFDMVPYRKRPDGIGEPEPLDDQPATLDAQLSAGFGVVESDEQLDAALDECRAVVRMLEGLGVRWICVTAASPYYNPHIQRPAAFPPLDGYEPPEDPLRGVARQIQATALLKRACPNMVFVGSAYSYLQEWLPNVGQCVLREEKADFIGLGRMVLSYPDLPADVLEGRPLRRKSLCRTFSDCTTAPRSGLVSGCYPLDHFYAARPEAAKLGRVKEALRA